jgi:hypothetical protein
VREERDTGIRMTLALPTKSEAGGIAGLIREAKEYADEILVVDGHSKSGAAPESCWFVSYWHGDSGWGGDHRAGSLPRPSR